MWFCIRYRDKSNAMMSFQITLLPVTQCLFVWTSFYRWQFEPLLPIKFPTLYRVEVPKTSLGLGPVMIMIEKTFVCTRRMSCDCVLSIRCRMFISRRCSRKKPRANLQVSNPSRTNTKIRRLHHKLWHKHCDTSNCVGWCFNVSSIRMLMEHNDEKRIKICEPDVTTSPPATTVPTSVQDSSQTTSAFPNLDIGMLMTWPSRFSLMTLMISLSSLKSKSISNNRWLIWLK